MTSLHKLAQQYLLSALADTACPGVCLVIPKRSKVNRPRLVAWAIDDCAQLPDSGQDSFRALYVSNSVNYWESMQSELLRYRRWRRRRQLTQHMYYPQAQPDPIRDEELAEITYVTLGTLRRQAQTVPPESVELLVLDEYQPGEMAQLMPVVHILDPLFILFITTRELPQDNPWFGLGDPLVLRGPAAAPPKEDNPAPQET